MSIKNLDFKSYDQDLTVNSENKLLYGEIFTPFSLIEKMFDLIPNHLFYDKNKCAEYIFLKVCPLTNVISLRKIWITLLKS